MYGIRFWKGNATFNRQSFDKGGDAEKMRRCEHFHWAFERGVPNDVIRCKDCGYWQYL